LRDRAVLLLLARLGLRASDVANLRLDDLDWTRVRIRVTGKSRQSAWLPLPQDAGDAVLSST
jgi:integrase